MRRLGGGLDREPGLCGLATYGGWSESEPDYDGDDLPVSSVIWGRGLEFQHTFFIVYVERYKLRFLTRQMEKGLEGKLTGTTTGLTNSKHGGHENTNRIPGTTL